MVDISVAVDQPVAESHNEATWSAASLTSQRYMRGSRAIDMLTALLDTRQEKGVLDRAGRH